MNHTKFEDQTDIISQALTYKTANYFDLIYLRLSLGKSSLQKVQYVLVFIAFNNIHVVVILSFVLFLYVQNVKKKPTIVSSLCSYKSWLSRYVAIGTECIGMTIFTRWYFLKHVFQTVTPNQLWNPRAVPSSM